MIDSLSLAVHAFVSRVSMSFLLMRCCFLGRWICLLVSEGFRLVWWCRLFDYSTYIPFCVHWHGGHSPRRFVPNYAVVFRLGCICQYRYVIGYRSYGNQTWPIKWNAVSSRRRSCRYCCMDALFGCWLNGWRRS